MSTKIKWQKGRVNGIKRGLLMLNGESIAVEHGTKYNNKGYVATVASYTGKTRIHAHTVKELIEKVDAKQKQINERKAYWK